MTRILAIGELLWDLLPAGEAIGGAPYNFAVHAARLGHDVEFVSAVGDDERGRRALESIGDFARHVGVVNGVPTGVARVSLGDDGQPSFLIERPAAYDFARAGDVSAPEWIAHGTLLAASPQAEQALIETRERFPAARRFYDVNLRPGQWTPDLVVRLLHGAHAVKLSEAEMETVARLRGLPATAEEFCRAALRQERWQAVAVTLGAEGCAAAIDGEVARCVGYAVTVADAVGAGDAFSAAFLHGVISGWSAARTGDFANRLGAIIASRSGATPEWSMADLDAL